MNKIITSGVDQKILIISDTHLTRRFDKRKYDFLKDLILQSDRVIINGDFWDSWFTTFDDFINSKWQKLFPYLLEKKTIYVFGNHDLPEKTDDRVKLFSVKSSDSYGFKINDKIYHIEHGRRILELKKDRFLLTYGQIVQLLGKYNFKVIFWILNLFEILNFKIFGRKMMHTNFAKRRNLILKLSNKNGWLICGDTHCPEVDNVKQFADSGCIMHGYASYLIINNREPSLHTATY